MGLVYEHLPYKPVVAVIYSHSHADHFGGVKGVVAEEDVTSGKVQIVASEGFMEFAVSENVLAGNVMARRASYMFGSLLPKNARGWGRCRSGQSNFQRHGDADRTDRHSHS